MNAIRNGMRAVAKSQMLSEFYVDKAEQRERQHMMEAIKRSYKFLNASDQKIISLYSKKYTILEKLGKNS